MRYMHKHKYAFMRSNIIVRVFCVINPYQIQGYREYWSLS